MLSLGKVQSKMKPPPLMVPVVFRLTHKTHAVSKPKSIFFETANSWRQHGAPILGTKNGHSAASQRTQRSRKS
jgi:hypothetical protein